MKGSICLLFIMIALNSLLYSQAQFSQEWVTRYNGSDDDADYAKIIKTDDAGNIYVTGSSTNSTSWFDIVTVKYSPDGEQLWAAVFDGQGTGFEEPTSLTLDNSGNVIITVNTASDITTVKYNSSGIQQWVRLYNGEGNGTDAALTSAVDEQGNIYAAGFSFGITNFDLILIKYNPDGVQQWIQKYNGAGNGSDCANAIKIDAAGNIYVTGWSYGNGTGNDFITLKYNASGVQQWASVYNRQSNSWDAARFLCLDDDGNIYVAGSSEIPGSLSDYVTIKYNAAGEQKWVRIYNGPADGEDEVKAMVTDNEGNIYLTGVSYGYESDFATVKYNSTGELQWVERFNGSGESSIDEATAIAVDMYNNVYVTGYSTAGGTDYYTIKYNTFGVKQWTSRFNGPGNNIDAARAVTVDNFGNVYVTGESININYDYTTIKYAQPLGIEPVVNKITSGFKLEQNFPNPFNPKTKIKFDIAQYSNSNIRLEIYNSLGQIIETQNIASPRPGSYEYEFDGSNYSSGVYYYQLIAGDLRETKKMILTK